MKRRKYSVSTCRPVAIEIVLRVPVNNSNQGCASSDGFLNALARALAPSTEAVTIADADGYILFANGEVKRVYRRSEESVLGKHPLTFCPKDFSRKFSKQIFEAIQNQGGWDGVVMNVDTAGRKFPILLRAVRVEFANVSYVISWAKPFPEKAPFKLSGKQAQCFRLLGQGLTPKEVAGQLGISISSVNTHLKRVKEAITKAQSAADARSRAGYNHSNTNQIDLGHLAVRCHEVGWDPMMRINQSLTIEK